MNEVLIYSSNHCPYCDRAKQLLTAKGMAYTEIRVDISDEAREEMIVRSGRRTVPQIFFGEKHIGGYDDLYAYFKANKE